MTFNLSYKNWGAVVANTQINFCYKNLERVTAQLSNYSFFYFKSTQTFQIIQTGLPLVEKKYSLEKIHIKITSCLKACYAFLKLHGLYL